MKNASASQFVVVVLAAGLLALWTGCERENRQFIPDRVTSSAAGDVTQSVLQPGVAEAKTQTLGPYDGNAWAVSEGQRLYAWFNCVGCHAQGGGSMGPALMDDKWIYGSNPENIFATIVEGRPNGMPSFRGKLSNQQVWQLVAYVRSLSGMVPKDVIPTRSDDMNPRFPEPQKTTTTTPTPTPTPTPTLTHP